MNKKIGLLIFVAAFGLTTVTAQTTHNTQLTNGVKHGLSSVNYKKIGLSKSPTLVACEADPDMESVTVKLNDEFSKQTFTEKNVKKIYKKIKKGIPSPYKKYDIRVISDGKRLENLVRGSRRTPSGLSSWGSIDYNGRPWTQNVSKAQPVTQGLQGRHISIWASHGRYYDAKKASWQWQRPNLFGTTEDLFTQTIVTPYVIPMLENAGAVVFTPRERDWQKDEVIVDNDNRRNGYSEIGSKSWSNTANRGFASHSGNYADGENPFVKGTARKVKTTKGNGNTFAAYQPNFPSSGRYAVYVSYKTLKKSVDDAEYIVLHKGQETTFRVNQQMGGGTWVYLGTFDFDKGSSEFNRVILTNGSHRKGFVTADAVRFGGGMGNIVRGGETSGLPRCLEGARYYTQWAGAPREVVSLFQGENDYNDDINCRSLMTNWLAGGSCYMPEEDGKRVPIELSLAVHSDAGFSREGLQTGTLSICTTDYKGSTDLSSGLSRSVSKRFAQSLLDQIKHDVENKFNVSWTTRGVWDKNYNESRRPEVPSAILETMSHQNFNDMRLGQDPNFKFVLGRAVYKTILKYISSLHHTSYTVAPLPPACPYVNLSGKNRVQLRWNAVNDPSERTATPTSFNVYTAVNHSSFDNGTAVRDKYFGIDLEPGSLYRFRITAANAGGESFPTEEVAALTHKDARKTVLIVNGFHRLAAPAIIDDAFEQGFDFNNDPGVPYGKYAGWNGFQTNYDKAQMGKEGPSALGFGGDELAGTFIMGNTFDYTTEHAEAIRSLGRYNIVSCSVEAVEKGYVNLSDYDVVDLILGLEENDGHSLVSYKSFSPLLQQRLANYTNGHGRLLVSGAYVGSDMQSDNERQFLSTVLKVGYQGQNRDQINTEVSGMGTRFDVWRSINEEHYSAVATDILTPEGSAYCALQYADGTSAAVAYDGTDYKTFVMGFPFECVKNPRTRSAIMRGILAFLDK